LQFKKLAQIARATFVALFKRAGHAPLHTDYAPHVAWMADLYDMADVDSAPLLCVQRLLLGEWIQVDGQRTLVSIVDDEQRPNALPKMRKKFGEPIAVHRYLRLEHDVFTASSAMIDVIFRHAESEPVFQEALASVITVAGSPESHAGGGIAIQAKSGPSALITPAIAPAPSRPNWVHEGEMVGPCSHAAFAKLMGISAKHLYDVIKQEIVWKEKAPTPRRFYFHHRDPKQHQQLRTAFERDRQTRS
jgi:hypothetical protein